MSKQRGAALRYSQEPAEHATWTGGQPQSEASTLANGSCKDWKNIRFAIHILNGFGSLFLCLERLHVHRGLKARRTDYLVRERSQDCVQRHCSADTLCSWKCPEYLFHFHLHDFNVLALGGQFIRLLLILLLPLEVSKSHCLVALFCGFPTAERAG